MDNALDSQLRSSRLKRRQLLIKTMATNALKSPRLESSKDSSSPLLRNEAAVSISLPMLAALTRIIYFLNENHLDEEGLYTKLGVERERKELLRFYNTQQRKPHLSTYSPHSIACAIKEILSELYEPLVPADISQQLLEAVSSGHIDQVAEHAIIEMFKRIRSSTREFLQVFLGHLNRLAENGSSRMSVANLALHVGIALIRPTEDKIMLNSKMMMRRRKCVAEFLIQQAANLPYDCATEMNIPAIPESLLTDAVDSKSGPQQLHFVQVSWDARKTRLTVEQLEKIFVTYGSIEHIGINVQGNRAMIAYVSAASAEEAEHAAISSVRVRRRKPRQGEKRLEYSTRNSDLLRPRSNMNLHIDTGQDSSSKVETAATDVYQVSKAERQTMRESFPIQSPPSLTKGEDAVQAKAKPLDDVMVIEDIEDDQIQHTETFPDRNNRAQDSETNAEVSDDVAVVYDAKIECANEKMPQVEQLKRVSSRHDTLEESSLVEIESTREAPQILTTSEILNTVSDIDTGIQKADQEIMGLSDNTEDIVSEAHPNSSEEEKHQDALLIITDSNQNEPTAHSFVSSDADSEAEEYLQSEKTQLEPSSQSYVPVQTSMQKVAPDMDTSSTAIDSSTSDGSVKLLRSKLGDMETVLRTTTVALSGTQLLTEFERAVFQLHKQILAMVNDCLVLAGVESRETIDRHITSSSGNDEFLDFLEAQAKTKVKILEVEVRAGQELLRLQKAQHEKERIELEEELTELRVGRREADGLCAELHTNLRKCRSELACHVANATSIQRQKSTLEEKLAICEDQLRAKEMLLTKAQAEYDKMHHVAAEAQLRVEKIKQSDYDADYQIDVQGEQLPRIRVANSLPHTETFLSKHSIHPRGITDTKTSGDSKVDGPAIPVKRATEAAVGVTQEQMTHDIKEQIATTKAALKEMESYSSSDKTQKEEEEELRQLQEQLAARSTEMDAAMRESRSRLQDLLEPKASLSPKNSSSNYDEVATKQEPTIFEYTTLVNELISRAERDLTHTSSREIEKRRIDESAELSRYAHVCRPSQEAQSVLYKKWTADRTRKMAQLASYRDHQAALVAQQSMHTFQQTLAEVRKQ